MNANVVARRIAGQTILVPISSHVGDLDSIYTLTAVGSSMWGLLAAPRTAREIAEAICAEYDVSMDRALPDVAAFLDLLASKGLICARPCT